MARREYRSAVIHVDGQRPISVICAVDQKRRSIGERRDRRQNAQDAREFLEAMQEGCLALEFARWSRENTI